MNALYMASCGMVDDNHEPGQKDLHALEILLELSLELLRKQEKEAMDLLNALEREITQP